MQWKTLRIACAAALVSGLFAPAIGAQDMNSRDRTYLTFSAPIQMPGRTLAAGRYLFQLMDSPSNRHIVQVFNAQGTRLIATVMAIPDQRLVPSENTTVSFIETPSSRPYAIRSWFYPGRTIGHEFVYPKSQAMAIAKATHQPVAASDHGSVSTVEPTEVDRNDDMNAMAETQNRPSDSVETPRVEPSAPAAVDQAPDNQATANQTPSTDGQAAAPTTTDQSLPKTASNGPLILLGGVSALGLALVIRKLRFVIS